MKIFLVGFSLLLLTGCSAKMAVCLDMGENSNTHTDFGYFYDSATFDINGPVKFERIPEDMAVNPCRQPYPPTSGAPS